MELIKRIKAMFGVGEQEQMILKAEPELKIGNIVAFKRGRALESSYGTVVAVKGDMAVVDTGRSSSRQMSVLTVDELIVIPPEAQERSND